MEKKYALHSGTVSSSDGDLHEIKAHQLQILYQLDRNDCIIWDSRNSIGRNWDDYVHLYPRDDGNYITPEASE